jgi:hypothetical protein
MFIFMFAYSLMGYIKAMVLMHETCGTRGIVTARKLDLKDENVRPFYSRIS